VVIPFLFLAGVASPYGEGGSQRRNPH